MANTVNGFGFRAFGHRDGSAPTMGLERVFILSSDTFAYFTGDPVMRSSVSGFGGYVQHYEGSSVAPICAGIFAGCEYYNPSIGRVVWNSYYPGAVSSSSPVTAYIISDPEMQFIVQCSSNGFYGSSQVGCNVTLVGAQSSLGNTATGISAVTISASAGSLGGSSHPFRLIDVYSNFAPPGVNGTDNTVFGNIIVVAPNNWDRKALTAVST